MAERTILETIVERRREDLLYAREALPLPRLAAMAKDAPPVMDFVARLRDGLHARDGFRFAGVERDGKEQEERGERLVVRLV